MTIVEGKVTLPLDTKDIVRKDDAVFYNPVMQFNRDSTLLVLRNYGQKGLHMCDLMAGSGIRSLRFLLELDSDTIGSLVVNDYREGFSEDFSKLMSAHGIGADEKIRLREEDANVLLHNCRGFDYIDIDPFGTPNPFLDAAVQRMSRKGILAVTATDTSALCGTYPNVCKRNYWATPARNELMHEVGLRILIRKVQLVGAQHEKALVPVFSYSKDHYMRVIFQCRKSKSGCDAILKQHGEFEGAGPMWLGSLNDKELVTRMVGDAEHFDGCDIAFLEKIRDELDVVGLYDLHEIASEMHMDAMKQDLIIEELRKRGHDVSLTHFREHSIKTTTNKEEIKKVIRYLDSQYHQEQHQNR